MFFCDFDLINESFEIKWKLSKVRSKKKHVGQTYFRLQTKGEKIPGSAGAYPVYRLCGYTWSEKGTDWIRSQVRG